MSKQRILVLTSGGDAPGMNQVLLGVIKTATFYNWQVRLVRNGYAGLLAGHFLTPQALPWVNLTTTSGSALGCGRLPALVHDAQVLAQIVQNLQDQRIDHLLVIGGDGSAKGAWKIAQVSGINCAVIPGTIDNDFATSEASVGFDSALNEVVQAISKIRATANSHQRVMLVEVMGRECVDLALRAGISAQVEAIVGPTNVFTLANFIEVLTACPDQAVIFVVVEKIYGHNGRPTLTTMAQMIEQQTGRETRVNVLGHLQRGALVSAMEGYFAFMYAKNAVEWLVSGRRNFAVCLAQNQVVAVDLAQVTTSKRVDDGRLINWYNQLVKKVRINSKHELFTKKNEGDCD